MGTEHTLSVNRNDLDFKFYSLDLGALKKAADTIGKKEIENFKINKNKVSFNADGTGVMLTIPYDEQWQVTVNGKTINAEKGAGAFLYIPLEGKSTVVMKYRTKGMAVGFALAAVSVILITAVAITCKKHNGK